MTDVTFTYRDNITVKLVDSMGNDASVIQAAKVSTLGENSVDEMDEDGQFGFINYLMKNRHGSPFEHATFKFYIECPIFVMREFIRHRMASYNEESGRYKKLNANYYKPNRTRKIVQTGKPGHYNFEQGTVEQYDIIDHEFMLVSEEAYAAYERMLEAGIAREVARQILPLNIFTSFYVTMNARGLMNFLSLRIDDKRNTFPTKPQYEIELVAKYMQMIFASEMPITYETFCKNGRVAP